MAWRWILRSPNPVFQPGAVDNRRLDVLYTAGRALKPFKIIPDSHGEGEQFFECLVRLVERDGDAAWLEPDPGGEGVELLREDLKRRLDQKLRHFLAVPLPLGQDFGELAPALALVMASVTIGQVAQVGDEDLPIGEPVGADAISNARSEDLLSAAAADAEQEFEGGAIDEGAGKSLELLNDVIDFAVPEGFGGHRGLRPC